MRKVIFLICFGLLNNINAQDNSSEALFFHGLKPAEQNNVLDSISNTDISYALSLRKLKRNYAGFCVKVRRSSDNMEMNIGFNGDGLVDTNAIKTFKGTGQAYISVWYDQTGLGRNAIQPTLNQQPELQFNKHKKFPVIKFDGVNDGLLIDTSVLILTNNGGDGSVFYAGNSTNRNQWTFGSYSPTNGSNRWSVHITWGNDNVYFDPGFCCNNPRNFSNVGSRDSFDQFSFLSDALNVKMRKNQVMLINGTHTNANCTANVGFGIGAAWQGSTFGGYANNSFLELIMYKIEVTGTDLSILEGNQRQFWKI